jgi:MFS family permease
MTRRTPAVTYRAVLRSPGVPHAFASAGLGRLSYTTAPLSLLLATQHATRSFAAAGLALGVFGAASAVAPAKSRLVDRHGRRRILPVVAAVYAADLLGTAAAAAAGVTAVALFIGTAALAGLTAPPLGPAMRAVWAELMPAPAWRQRAYSLDTVVEEVFFALGPVLVGVIVAVWDAPLALALTAILVLVGTIGLASAPGGRPAPIPSPYRLVGPLRDRGFPVLLGLMFGIGLGLGPIDVAVAARAEQAGRPAAAGYLLAALSIGSAAGGLAWGRREHRGAAATQLRWLIGAMALALSAAWAAPTLPLLGLLLAALGTAVAPAFVVAYLAADALVPQERRTEASTWINTANNMGVALGAAGAGLIADHATPATPMAAGAATLGATLLWCYARSWRDNTCA